MSTHGVLREASTLAIKVHFLHEKRKPKFEGCGRLRSARTANVKAIGNWGFYLDVFCSRVILRTP